MLKTILKPFLILILGLVFTYCSTKSNNNAMSEKADESGLNQKVKGDFIGYRNDMPVFSSLDSNVLYFIKNDKVEQSFSFPSKYKALLINDKAIFYQNKDSKEIAIAYQDSEIIIPYDNYINSLCSTNEGDSIFFESPVGRLNLLIISKREIKRLPVLGQNPKTGNGYLFFSRYSDSSSSEPHSNLFRLKIDKNFVASVVGEEIHEEWYLSSDSKFIACLVSKDSKWNNGILNIDNGKIKYFDMSDIYSQAYFSIKDQAFFFYNQNDILNYKVIKVE